MSSVTAHDFNSIYRQKGIITAFKEAGYRTAFFSINAITILSSISLEKKPIYAISLKKIPRDGGYNPSDDELLKLVAAELAENVSSNLSFSTPMVLILIIGNAIRRTTLFFA